MSMITDYAMNLDNEPCNSGNELNLVGFWIVFFDGLRSSIHKYYTWHSCR